MEKPTGPDAPVPAIVTRVEKFLDDLAHRPIWLTPKTVYSAQGFAYATFNRRMMASMVDACILTFLMLPFNNAIMGYVYGSMQFDGIPTQQIVSHAQTQQDANIELVKAALSSGGLRVFAVLSQIQYTLMAAYSFAFWHFYSATPGKMLMRLKIVNVKTGEPITDRQSFIRLLGYLVAGLPAMIGFFVIGWTRHRQGWHDMLAGTAVIVISKRAKAKSAPPADDPSDSPEPSAAE